MIIDFASRPPLPQFNPPAPHLGNYRRVYEASETITGRDIADAALAGYLKTYDDLRAERVVLKARDLETTFRFKISNDDVAAFCRSHGPRYIGFAGVDPHKGGESVRELERAVRELGLIGLNVQCFEHKLRADDRLLYPLYEKCVELGIPANIHSGTNFSTQIPIAYGRPEALDQVLIDFPDLRICASPPGWPWVQELIAVAWRHQNLFIGLVAVRPRYLAVPDTGYGPLLRYGSSILKERIIFGSSFPMMPVSRSVEEVRSLPIEPEIADLWLHRNARRFLRIDT